MPQIVVGSYMDFAGAARGASALVAAGLVHGEVSIIARRPAPRLASAIALSAGALGAVIAPGSVLAFGADMMTLFAFAPMGGALAGALLGTVAMVVDRRACARTEEVRVAVDGPLVARVESILRASGASLGRARRGPLRPPVAVQPPRLVPYRP